MSRGWRTEPPPMSTLAREGICVRSGGQGRTVERSIKIPTIHRKRKKGGPSPHSCYTEPEMANVHQQPSTAAQARFDKPGTPVAATPTEIP